MEDYGIEKYFEYFFSIYNPIFLAFILFLLLFVVVYIIYRHIYHPLLRKHRKEKESLELRNAKLLVLFTELDPNPIIKINLEGLIVGMNNSAKEKFQIDSSTDSHIELLIDKIDFNIKDLISSNQSKVLNLSINKRSYEVNIHGISLLDMAQLYFYDVTEKKEHLEQMSAYQKLLKESSARSIKELEQERSRLSALLHDSVGQNLLLLKLGIQNLKKFLNGPESQEEFQHTSKIIETTINEIKEISRSIRPLNLEELGLKTVLASLCKNVSRECRLDYSLNLPEEDISLNDEYETCLYRVAQECLNNIIKHSKAKTFSVNLSIDDVFITLLISDDGIGFKPSIIFEDKYISDGMGLMNMQDRVERLNGNFHIDSTINNGTLVIINLPNNDFTDEEQYKY